MDKGSIITTYFSLMHGTCHISLHNLYCSKTHALGCLIYFVENYLLVVHGSRRATMAAQDGIWNFRDDVYLDCFKMHRGDAYMGLELLKNDP